jgi:hypothetical protein
MAAFLMAPMPTTAAEARAGSPLEGLASVGVVVEFNKDISLECRERIRTEAEKRMKSAGLGEQPTGPVATLTVELMTTPVVLSNGKEAGVAAFIRLYLREPAQRVRLFHKEVSAETWLIRNAVVAPRAQLDKVVCEEAMNLFDAFLKRWREANAH